MQDDVTNRTLPLTHTPTDDFPRPDSIIRGGFGEENTLADAIPLFHYYFHCSFFPIPCFSRTCKILCTIVSPFLTQPGLLVMGGCIIGWVSSVVQLPSVCASTLSGTHVFRFRAVYIAERIITEPRSGKLYGGRFLYEGNPRELTAIPSKISVLEIIHHDVSKLSELSPIFDLT